MQREAAKRLRGCCIISAAAAQQAATNLHQIAETYLAVAILIEQAAQQTTTQAALLLRLRMLAAQHLAQAAGIHAACAHALCKKGHDDGGQQLQQLSLIHI